LRTTVVFMNIFWGRLNAIFELARKRKGLLRRSEHLEELVKERTGLLTSANEQLKRGIEERKEAREALDQSEDRFRKLVETTGDWVWEVNDRFVYEYVSPQVKEMLGYEPEEVLGKSPFDLMPQKEDLRIAELIRLLVEKKKPIIAMEKIHIHKKGHPVVLETSGVPFFDKDGNFAGYRGIDRDVSQRKRIEKELDDYRGHLEELVRGRTAELKAANEELEAFTYSVSHDLRAPLRAIDGFSRIVLDDYSTKLDAEAERLLNIIRSNTQKMGQLIDDLLSFSRIGRREIRTGTVDMKALANGVIQDMRLSSPGEALDFEVKEIPPAYGDGAMLRQVFFNLLANAVKFTKGRDEPRIEISGRKDGDEAVYRVKDNGIGFDMRYAAKLFGMFQRLHPAHEFEGTGVGLAIVQRIVHRHGGRVWAEGEVNKGAGFYFTLPLKQDGGKDATGDA